MTDAGEPITAKKSYRSAFVRVTMTLRCSGYGNDSARIEGSTELSIAQARALAASLSGLADQAEAKVTKETAAANRRKAWQDREIASGRMVMLGGRL